MRTFAAILLIFAVHLLVGWPAYRDIGFLADDWWNVGLAALGHASGPSVGEGATAALFRPLLPKLFWLEWQLFGTWAPGYHATNSLLHCGAAVVLMQLVGRLSGSRFAGLGAGLLAVNHPACSEVTHWIMARTNLLAACFGLAGVCCWVRADLANGRAATVAFRLPALVLLGTALLGKETAFLLLPALVVLAALRPGDSSGRGQRVRQWLRDLAPLGVLVFAYVLVRWLTVHTLAVGAAGSWQPLGSASLFELLGGRVTWIWQVMAPVHVDFGPRWLAAPLRVAMVVLLGAGLAACWRADPPARRLGAFLLAWLLGAAALSTGFAHDPDELTGVRNDFEAVLATAALAGIGLALLARGRWLALAVLVSAQAVCLDGNRQAWLAAGRLSARVRQEVVAQARMPDPRPVRVHDVPSTWHGALVKSSEWFEYMPPFAPPGVAERVVVTNDGAWAESLRELAAARAGAAGGDVRRFQVAWTNGQLLPLELDGRWPKALRSGTTLHYARAGRTRLFARCELPVQVLLRGGGAPVPIRVQVSRAGAGVVAEAARVVEFAGDEALAELRPRLPAALAPGPVRVELRVGEESVPLATVEVVER